MPRCQCICTITLLLSDGKVSDKVQIPSIFAPYRRLCLAGTWATRRKFQRMVRVVHPTNINVTSLRRLHILGFLPIKGVSRRSKELKPFMAPLKLLALQDELLERIFLKLPQKARARSAVACKRLYHLTVTSSRIYETLHVALGNHRQAERLMVWLAHKRHLVRHLAVLSSTPITLEGMRYQVQLEAAFLGATCHPRLVSLELTTSTPIALGGWVASLCGLQYLSINCPCISVSYSVSQLTCLTSMAFSTAANRSYSEFLHVTFNEATLVLQDNCLPSSLKELRLCSESQQLPGAVHTATQLTLLVAGGVLLTSDGLEPLQHLTALCTLGLDGPDGLPEVLSTLTALTTLCIQDGALSPESLEGIAKLTGIKELSLRYLAQVAVPPAVLELQQLTFLDLRGNPLAGPLLPASAPLLGQLKTLALPAAVANSSLQLLACLTALNMLALDGDTNGVALRWEELLGAAAGLASHRLRMLCIWDDAFLKSEEGQAALTKFSTAWPLVALRKGYFTQPPGLQPRICSAEELELLGSER